MSIIDHLTVVVTHYARSKAFYEKAFAPLGIKLIMEFGEGGGFGRDGKPELWIGVGPASFHKPEHLKVITPMHVALVARSRDEVQAFYRAAIEAGGRDFGGPGLRPEYHPNYFGAFVLDPDGHNIEAVHHGV
jgi:catechol 2,3-dioxygenase-like lactoylglutathione lyase family enzyme